MGIPPYTGRVAAVVLDWAGTTVDYGCRGPTSVFVDVLEGHGIRVSSDDVRRYMGLGKMEHLRALCDSAPVGDAWRQLHGRSINEDDLQILYTEIEQTMTAAVARHADLIPGLPEAIAAFRRQGLRIGTCTGYPRPVTDVLVDAARRSGFQPDTVVCTSDVPAGRPFPWMCYQNAIHLQVYPMAAMVKIGDTVSDIQEGLNAGMWTIGLTKTGNELGLSEAQVDALPPDDLTSRLEAIEKRMAAAGAHYTVDGIADCPAVIAAIDRRLQRGERP